MIAELPRSVMPDMFANTPATFFAPYHERPEQQASNYIYHPKEYRGAMRAELPVAEAKIDEIALMPDNWDGYGAVRIGQETKRNAKNALNTLHTVTPIPDITPNPNGTISLEWESPEGFGHLEIGRTKFSFYIKPRLGSTILVDGDADKIDANIGIWVSDMLFPLQHSAETIKKIWFL